MKICWLWVFAGLLTAGNLGATSIQFDVSNVGVDPFGDPIFRYNYLVSGITLGANQEIDIRFDPTLFGTLFNAAPVAGFDILLFQPNDPVGAQGIYSALALINNPSLSNPFTVDVTWIGPREGVPGAQLFFINEYDTNGGFRVIESGVTSAPAAQGVPEPATFVFTGAALAIGAAWRARGRLRPRVRT